MAEDLLHILVRGQSSLAHILGAALKRGAVFVG
jgi:hypothetical protein